MKLPEPEAGKKRLLAALSILQPRSGATPRLRLLPLSTRTPHPSARRYAFCCTIPSLAAGGCYPSPCPVKPGLSSRRRSPEKRPASDRPAHSLDLFIVAGPTTTIDPFCLATWRTGNGPSLDAPAPTANQFDDPRLRKSRPQGRFSRRHGKSDNRRHPSGSSASSTSILGTPS